MTYTDKRLEEFDKQFPLPLSQADENNKCTTRNINSPIDLLTEEVYQSNDLI